MHPISSAWRVYFVVGSKEGFAEFSIDHAFAGQTLILPVYPSEAVTECLPLLEPPFAHYAAQWRKIMVDDPNLTDARGFYLEAMHLPPRIADPAHQPEISRIANAHLAPELKASYGKDVVALVTGKDRKPPLGNIDDVCVQAAEAGIDPFRDDGSP